MKAIEIKGLRVEFVSYVKKGANKKKFFLVKSEEGSPEPNVEKEVKILINKEEDSPHLIYGIVYSPGEVDSQNNFMTAKEIQSAQHNFLKDYRLIDEGHSKIPGAGEVVECSCALVDMEIEGELITKGSWILVTEPDDEVWELIKSEEYTGYSLYGFADELVESEVRKETVWDKLKNIFGIKKDFDEELINYQNTDFWHLWYLFEDSIWKISWDNPGIDGPEFKKKLLKNLSQLTSKVKEMTFEKIEKENKTKTPDGESDSNKQGVQMDEQLKKEITELFEPQFAELKTSIETIQKSIETPAPEPDPKPEDIPGEKENPIEELKKEFELVKTRLTTAEEALLISQANPNDTKEKDIVKLGIKTCII